MKVRFVSEGKMKNLLVAHGYTIGEEDLYSKTENGMVGNDKRNAFGKVYNARLLGSDTIYKYSVYFPNFGETLVQDWLIEEEIHDE